MPIPNLHFALVSVWSETEQGHHFPQVQGIDPCEVLLLKHWTAGSEVNTLALTSEIVFAPQSVRPPWAEAFSPGIPVSPTARPPIALICANDGFIPLVDMYSVFVTIQALNLTYYIGRG